MKTSSNVDSLIQQRQIFPSLESRSSNSSKALERQKFAFLMMKTKNQGLVSMRQTQISSPKDSLISEVSSSWNPTFTCTFTLYPCPYFYFNCLGLSRQTNWPFIRIPISEQRDSASFIEWVVRTIDVSFDLAAAVRHFQRNLLEMGSTPAEGSSRNTTQGLPIKAIPTHIFLLFPPLKTPAFTFKQGPNDSNQLQKLMVGCIICEGMPLMRQKYSRCSQVVIFQQMGLYCGQTPTLEKISIMPLFTSWLNN